MVFFKRKRTQFLRPRNKRRRTRAPMPVRLVRTRRLTRFSQPGPRKSGIVRDKRIKTLRYTEVYAETVGGLISPTSFRANDIFDPTVAIGGHQARGFDQWMIMYNKWVVLSSTITVKCWTRSSTEPVAFNIVTVDPSIDLNDATLLDMLENNPRTTRSGSFTADGGGSRGGFVKAGVNVAKFLNRQHLADDTDLHGTDLVGPTKRIDYHVNFIDAGSFNVGQVEVIVNLTYRVMFLEPNKVLAS